MTKVLMMVMINDDDDIFVTNILPADGGGDKEGKGNSPQTQASPLKKPQL